MNSSFNLHQFIEARKAALSSGKPLDAVLLELQGGSPLDLLENLGRHFHYPTRWLEGLGKLQVDLNLMPISDCRRFSAAVVMDGNETWLLFSDPVNEELTLWAERHAIPYAQRVLVLQSSLTRLLTDLESTTNALSGVLDEGFAEKQLVDSIEEISLSRIDETSSQVIRLVNSTLYDALGAAASDIHLEATAQGLVVKYRIDGVIVHVASLSGVQFNEQVISRIKVMSELDITERRTPQDGRFKVRIRERDIDFRVSIMPSVFGEDAVIRILDKDHLSSKMAGLTLDYLGFNPEPMAVIRKLAAQPYGMLLITGPTGSGKTTTLYAAITEINDGKSKIITIEDPVEYQVAGVLQIPVNERKGLSFARGLRSILRHDPDKIMVGEIRDGETAQIAIQAALTGHLVFSTIHANNVFDVLGRFEHMGVDPYTFVSALNGIVAQRLVRVYCTVCRGSGCPECRGTGYKGRKAIGECLIMDDEMRDLIASRASIRKIKEAAKERGIQFLRESAEELLRNGLTSQAEIDRVTFARE
jgi:general secretion pathway protein E